MSLLYRVLLRLYPPGYRREFGEEMMAVFCQAQADIAPADPVVRIAFAGREIRGLLAVAIRERFRPWDNILSRRFTMRSEYRFPKTTAVLMTIILAGVLLAMEKARAISASWPRGAAHLALQPEHPTFVVAIGIMFAAAYVLAIVIWAVLFALRRSGVHRLDALSMHGAQR